jgi:hypothetical protein
MAHYDKEGTEKQKGKQRGRQLRCKTFSRAWLIMTNFWTYGISEHCVASIFVKCGLEFDRKSGEIQHRTAFVVAVPTICA